MWQLGCLCLTARVLAPWATRQHQLPGAYIYWEKRDLNVEISGVRSVMVASSDEHLPHDQ